MSSNVSNQFSNRSSTQIFFVVPNIGLNRYGKHTFKIGAVMVWNSITNEHLKQSEDITRFKRRLVITAPVLFTSIIFTLFYVLFLCYVLITHQNALSSSPTLRKRYFIILINVCVYIF